jgi:type I restriction enzyme, S subunit
MICDLKPYPEMKGTSIPWLGELPVGWSVCRNGSLFNQRTETGFADLPILEVSLKTGVRVREFGGTSRKQIMEDRAKYKRASCGDLAYNMMRMWQGAIGVAPVDGLVSPAYVVARPLPGVLPSYFAYLFRTDAYMGEVDNYSRGIVKDRNRLYWERFKQIQTPCPPATEQAAILRFLDHTDRKIRRYIRAKQMLIKLLEEQKQAIIHRAVTRGLDADVRLKPSGVEWLGEIPEHWEVVPVGAISILLQTGPFGSQLHQSDYISGGIPVINPSHMVDGRIAHDPEIGISAEMAAVLSRHAIKPDDILIARRGDLGRCALVSSREDGWVCGTGSMLLRCRKNMILPKFFRIIFSSSGIAEELQLSSIGATMANLNEGVVARQRIPLPALEDQAMIIGHLEKSALPRRLAKADAGQDMSLNQ